ncbi:MAG: hypothetical protein HOD72_12065 [Opitutae bacterium]|nr:hypothetical protein [Opitutae bacterium]
MSKLVNPAVSDPSSLRISAEVEGIGCCMIPLAQITPSISAKPNPAASSARLTASAPIEAADSPSATKRRVKTPTLRAVQPTRRPQRRSISSAVTSLPPISTPLPSIAAFRF